MTFNEWWMDQDFDPVEGFPAALAAWETAFAAGQAHEREECAKVAGIIGQSRTSVVLGAVVDKLAEMQCSAG